MRDLLFLSLRPPGADGLHDYARAPGSTPTAAVAARGSWEAVLELAASHRVVAFAPADAVRLASVSVPSRQAAKVRQAAPYALEDQLADEIDELHFAIGASSTRAADGAHPVAVVARAAMDQWLAPLRAAGLAPESVLPECLCLPPPQAGEWVLLLAKDGDAAEGNARWIVRSGANAGFSCGVDQLEGWLALAGASGPERLVVYPTAGNSVDFTRLGRPVDLRPGHRHALEVLARYRGDDAIDLLQGDYARNPGWIEALKPWRSAAVLAAVLALLAVVHQGVGAWQLGRELAAQEARNLQRFQALYPAETRIVDLAAQVQQKLSALANPGATRAPWFDLLQVVAESLAQNPGLRLQSVQLRDGALYLQLGGSDLQAFESMRLWYEARTDARISDVQANSGTEGVRVSFKLELRA